MKKRLLALLLTLVMLLSLSVTEPSWPGTRQWVRPTGWP